MKYLFTSESVSKGHPDKICDIISDGLLDEFLKQDEDSKVAIETLTTTGLVVVSGEVKSKAYVNIDDTIRDIIKDIGYTGDIGFNHNCGIISAIHDQSSDIRQGVEKEINEMQGAGDQGIMFGYATDETEDLMPITIVMSHQILSMLDEYRKNKYESLLKPDAKSQVTILYENDIPVKLDTILISTQHEDIYMAKESITNILEHELIPELFRRYGYYDKLDVSEYKLLVNPTGRFVIGGPQGDTGLTGRKIIVDTYGGWGAHGGGCFSGKDPSKVDRSGAYAARHISKNLIAAGLAKRILVQLSYAIGLADPISVYVNSYGTGIIPDDQIVEIIKNNYDLRPYHIIKNLKLKSPIYKKTSSYGHFGRTPYIENGIEYFTWEKLDVYKNFI